MITIIYGQRNDAFEKVLKQAIESAGKNAIVERRGNALFASIQDELMTPSLFGEKKAFIVSGWFDKEHSETKDAFLEGLDNLESAAHDLIITAESIAAADLKKIGTRATVHAVKEKIAKESAFNPFTLANAFASGDKKNAWINFCRVANQGDEMEPTHGMIWWKLKDMMQKKSSFTQQQLISMARSLVGVYHESRLGGPGMRERLELFFLTMPSK